METLRKEFSKLLELDYESVQKQSKLDEVNKLTFLHEDKYYKAKIFNTFNDDTLDVISPILEFCENPGQHDLWNYFRVFTSSIKTYKNIGRNIRVLVKDAHTEKYIGIFSIASDLRQYNARDKYIDWNVRENMDKLVYIVNINCCVGLQPFAYNYNLGKLLVALCYSKEMQDYYFAKYNNYFACVTTFSINGKSIQYDRMKPYLKYVGETKGFGTLQVNDKLYDKAMKFLKNIKDCATIAKTESRLFKIKKVLEYLDIPLDVLNHGKKRGVYIGFTSKDAISFFQGKCETFELDSLKTVSEIYEWWKHRWASQRFAHLKETGRIKFKVELINPRKIYNIVKTQKHIEKVKEDIGVEEYKKQQAEYMREYRESKKYSPECDLSNIYLENKTLNPSYIAGFFDGDGSLIIKQTKNYMIVTVEISQCHPIILLYLQKQYGGSIHEKMENGKKRNQFKWNLNGIYTEVFLNDIKDHIIVDSRKVDLALEFIREFKEDNQIRMVEIFGLFQKESKDGNITKPYDRINDAYIGGMMDAEGCIGLVHHQNRKFNITLSITQKNDETLLEHIQKYLGYGKVMKGRYLLYNTDKIKTFLYRLKEFIMEKEVQLMYTLKVLEEEYTDAAQMKSYIDKVIDEKHRIIKLENLKVINQKGRSKMKSTADKSISEAKQQRNLENNRRKSEAMKGEKNWNFGKERSEDHCLKIALNASLAKMAKRSYTDEQIDQVLNFYHQDKIKMVEIVEKTGLSRSIISDIVHKKILKTTDITMEVIKQRKERKEAPKELSKGELISKKKRKNSVLALFNMIKYKKEHTNISYVQLAKDSLSLFGESMTLAQVKLYCYGKTKLPENELGENWEMYKSFGF